ncbi:hypothetical protein [Streptosporangium sp. G12]
MLPIASHGRRGRRLVRWLVLALVVLFVITRPSQAADTATALMGHAVTAGDSLLTFMSALG